MTRKQYSFLRFISPGADVSKVERRFRNVYKDPDINDMDFQKYFYRHNGKVYISVLGKDIIEARYTGNLRWWFSIILSVLALCVSIVSIALQYV